MPLLLLFIAVPLIEIALFIQLGNFLSLGWILLIVVLTAVLGTWLVRQQGRDVIAKLQQSFTDLNDPTEPLAHGAMILLAGVFLLTPGLLTDTVGFLLLVPKIRERVFGWIRARVVMTSSATMSGASFTSKSYHPQSNSESVIDGDYTEVEAEPRRTKGPSGWTRD